jgi:2-dehydropantoate 2-reductase
MMRILIVGAGALGGYFGGCMVEDGQDVTLLARLRRAARPVANGSTIRSPREGVDRSV